ncbi:disulfide bond formation protein DsbA [Arthrobacter sp. BB-1]|jgi:protein-disulfide isomerase|uniref:DsbA family protein n=1 Tax=unclassified Arthrobacter TaxID=235627 RepID=UPI0011125FB4|nr:MULTISPECIES: thioredoxin domain-containing protein [unclassified Arthrobacter]TNB76275.1 disulfide bond formation protein DsbA [Arthrobacter sp. BB-1]
MVSNPAPPRDSARLARKVIWIILALIVAGCVAWYSVLTLGKPPESAPQPGGAEQLVRTDSHRLTSPAVEKAQLVEFLDFECPSCGSIHPVVEEFKAEFGDRITFVHRHFPLSAHPNSGQAALAAEAAGQQGQYQQMANRLFETQAQWAGSQQSQAPLFRTYAEQLGLDLSRFDAAVADPKTEERILADIADGEALGVTGTPTFFLNGEKLTLTTKADFRQKLADAAK